MTSQFMMIFPVKYFLQGFRTNMNLHGIEEFPCKSVCMEIQRFFEKFSQPRKLTIWRGQNDSVPDKQQ